MGIPGFFAWIRKNCPFLLKKVVRGRTVVQEIKTPVDNLCLDMNGIIHEAAQIVYKYGNHKQIQSKIHPEKELPPQVMKKRLFYQIGKIIDTLMTTCQPRKRVLVMVDGPASKSKRAQQRSRRYRSVQDTEKKFDTNAISPGTEFMDHMSKYLDYYIRHNITNNPLWRNVEVILSNEKVPGEGEHKLINFIRRYGTNQESYAFYGLDADLIMLTLSIQNRLPSWPKPAPFYIVREDLNDIPGTLITIDISMFREWLIQELTWGLECTREGVIDDFIFICFLLGNDFLPHSPSIDLLDGGIELLFSSYSLACEKENCHLIIDGQINKKVFKELLFQLTLTEKMLLEDSIQKDVFADPLLQKHIRVKPGEDSSETPLLPSLDYEAYREEFYRTKLHGATPLQVCHDFFWGMEWVFKYYTLGVPSWDWEYPHSYSPFAKEMCDALDTYQTRPFVLGRPIKPFLQLLTILPPQSKGLLPKPLGDLLDGLPTEVKLDLSGKKFEWQAVAILPPLPEKMLEQKYLQLQNEIPENECRRDRVGKEYIYRYDPKINHMYRSFYGIFDSCASVHYLS